jgi:hypothetical protein
MQLGHFELCAGDRFQHRPHTSCLLCGEPLIFQPSIWVLLNPSDEPGQELVAGICRHCSDRYSSEAELLDAITRAICKTGIQIEIFEGTA